MTFAPKAMARSMVADDMWHDCRVKVLKRHSRLAVTLAPKAMPRSMVADDIVGMTVAGLAMSAALVTIWLAQRNTPYGVLYLAIYVAGYILKVHLAT